MGDFSSRSTVAVALFILLTGVVRAEETAVLPGDEMWNRRADGASGSHALPGPVDAAIAVYRKTISEKPENLTARWHLMRALYFKAEYTTGAAEEKKRIFDEGKTAGEEALQVIRRALATKAGKDLDKATPLDLAPLAAKDRETAFCFLWAAVNWGKWSLVYGKTAAVRQGAAAKIRDYSKAVIAMDPELDDAGGYRVLGRLHHQTPSVPFFTGWASRDEALSNLRTAVKVAPKNLINRLYLAEAIWDYEKNRRAEARGMLETLIAEKPSPALLIEDLRTQEEAKALLAGWGKP